MQIEVAASMAKLNMLEEFETSAPVPRDGMNAYLDNSQRGQEHHKGMILQTQNQADVLKHPSVQLIQVKSVIPH